MPEIFIDSNLSEYPTQSVADFENHLQRRRCAFEASLIGLEGRLAPLFTDGEPNLSLDVPLIQCTETSFQKLDISFLSEFWLR